MKAAGETTGKVYEGPNSPVSVEIALLSLLCTRQYEMENKLSPKWTGPFRITEALGNGAYRLETLEGGAIPRTWNATHLKLCYS